MIVRRFGAFLTLITCALAANDAQAWVPINPAGSCATNTWTPSAHIKFLWSNDETFSAAEKGVIRIALQQYNHLANSRIYIHEADESETCDVDDAAQPANTICIGTCGTGTDCGLATVPNPGGNCRHAWCEIVVDSGTSLANTWSITSQEVAHCFGLDHTPNDFDWMDGAVPSNEHVGMTRDTLNGLNYLYPFGTNFYFGNFSPNADVDILTRDNQPSGNAVPWNLSVQETLGETWIDAGQVMSDHGDETTLAYLFGDFTGDGCPDAARGLCNGCNPGDGAGDVVDWNVKPNAGCSAAFMATQDWHSDFGNGEDFDQYKVGDFDGDGCDDVWMIRNDGAYDCTGGSTCAISIWWMLSRRPNGASCAAGGSAPDHFVTHGSQYSIPSTLVTDRSGVTAWTWVVGDFETTDGLGCDDLLVGRGDQSDPRTMPWRVFRARDTNANGLCDTLSDDGTWLSTWGELGDRYAFAAEAGSGAPDDLILVIVQVFPAIQDASWYVAYSDGGSAFTNAHKPVQDHLITGAESHWTGMVFGVGDFDTVNGGVDFITLRGANSTGAVKAKVAYRAAGSGSWSLSSFSSDVVLPTALAAWNQPTDEDTSTAKDNGGDDAKGTWWCRDDDVAYCSTCSGCCPVSCCSTQCGP